MVYALLGVVFSGSMPLPQMPSCLATWTKVSSNLLTSAEILRICQRSSGFPDQKARVQCGGYVREGCEEYRSKRFGESDAWERVGAVHDT